jgi:glucose/arabinose dehydrogenase
MESTKRMRRARLSVMSVAAVALLAACLATLLWWKVEPARSATTVPQGFTDSLVAQVSDPTAMAIAPDGRLFVAEQTGALRVIKNGQLLSKPFVQVTTNVTFFQGLLGVTVDPKFSQNHYVYVFYTATSPTIHNRVSRFKARGDVAGSAHGEKVLLELPPLGGQSGQYGGALRFGADGKLYVGVGDDTTAANAQSLNTVNGKILRINRDGTIPTTNPFYSSTSGNSRAIWALGLRQPFSLDVRSGTPSKMFVNDVGKDTWEEINQVARGANYGWPTYEGPTDPPAAGFQNPVFSYQHGTTADTGCAITGGAFYDPTAPTTPLFPAEYQGDYFYADFCSGWIRGLDLSTNTTSAFASGIDRPIDLEVAEDGSLYYLFKATGAPDAVHMIRYAGGAG